MNFKLIPITECQEKINSKCECLDCLAVKFNLSYKNQNLVSKYFYLKNYTNYCNENIYMSFKLINIFKNWVCYYDCVNDNFDNYNCNKCLNCVEYDNVNNTINKVYLYYIIINNIPLINDLSNIIYEYY